MVGSKKGCIFAVEMKISKKRYLQSFLGVTLALAIVRCLFPSVATGKHHDNQYNKEKEIKASVENSPSGSADTLFFLSRGSLAHIAPTPLQCSAHRNAWEPFFKEDGSLVRNHIYSVPGYQKTFEDQQDVQVQSASKYGIKPIQNRAEAMKKRSGLVYVGSNPYYYIDRLHSSIPYLVPNAAILLQDIGHTYFDSLTVKGIPLHKIIVTSVLRSKEDVASLRGHNGNATQNSCHLYGTTFDICYNRYKTVAPPGEHRHEVRNDTLKYVLAEVLRDMRNTGRCYVKYEVNQGCFHITVK